jgi:histone-lysine N-methyltransferase MLL3
LFIIIIKVDKDDLCPICSLNDKHFEELYCTNCGTHYHSSCLSLKIECSPIVRAGWQCPECKVCQTCRKPGEDSKILVCDTCDKGYHTFCLRPEMITIPKDGWKCQNCRICAECHASNNDNKWHLNYTLCDLCYQNGSTCHLCKKSCKQSQLRSCCFCNRYVHADCDKTFIQDLNKYVCMSCRPVENCVVDNKVEILIYQLSG